MRDKLVVSVIEDTAKAIYVWKESRVRVAIITLVYGDYAWSSILEWSYWRAHSRSALPAMRK